MNRFIFQKKKKLYPTKFECDDAENRLIVSRKRKDSKNGHINSDLIVI